MEFGLRSGYMGELTYPPNERPPRPLLVYFKHDKCPMCRNISLPRARPGVTAVACRECGHVVEIRTMVLPGLFDDE